MNRRHLIGLFLTSFSLLPACGDRAIQPKPLDARALHGFESCDELLDYTSEHALELMDAHDEWDYGLPGFGEDDGAGEGGDDGGNGGDGDGGPDYSETNVQEAGVDEPDVIKTDGERILAIAQGELHYIDATGMEAELVGSLALPNGWGPEMFLWEDRALIISRSDNWELPENIQPDEWIGEHSWVEVTNLIEVDLSDPADMKIVRSVHLGGGYVSARLVDSVARVVIRSNPVGLHFKGVWDFYEEPEMPGWEEAAKKKAREHNEQVLADATPENWLPQYVIDDGGTSEGLVVECQQAMRPGEGSGLGMLAVVTVDLSEGLALGEGTGVFSTGETVYASKESLYVSTQPWWWWGWGFGDGGVDVEPGGGDGGGGVEPDPGDPVEPGEVQFRDGEQVLSYIHQFDISDDARARYVGSGAAPGYLLSQWSMSEYEGDLRVASTDPGPDWEGDSQSFVTVLRPGAGGLEQIGQVGGLGEGEQIYAVRMMEEVGYVVTFRQIDPLYTVDLSDPTNPEVLGELKIPGYSAYLHPVGDGLLLGIGQNATDEGQLLGAQASLFDVSDLDNPERLHTHDLGEGSSDIEFDHRAFLYWQQEQLAAIPVQSWWWDGEEEHFDARVVGLRIDRDTGFSHVGDIEHPADPNEYWDWMAAPRRSLVIDDLIYTLSERGLKASDIDSFADRVWIEF